MEQFVVSARKYRPSSFDKVVGQEHVTKTLQNAIARNQLAQAMLFCGPRGVGKTTCARILAHTINEFDDNQQTAQSLNIYELDAASNNSVDDIRNLIDQVRYPPQYGKYKVYIIDEVHMLSNAAFNAFLKTLEEPPPYAIFILATTEKHKVIPTILSRCQIFDFNRIGLEDIVDHLGYVAKQEHIETEPEALHLIAQKADGALRDALSFFDMIVTFTSDNKVTLEAALHNLHVLDYDFYFKVTDRLLEENTPAILLILDEILAKGFDPHNFINGLSEHFRNLLVCKDPATVQLLEVSGAVSERYLLQANQTSKSFLLTAMNIANQCDLGYKNSKNPRLHVEIALMKMAHIPVALQLAKKKTSNSYLKGNDASEHPKEELPAKTKEQEKKKVEKVEKKETAVTDGPQVESNKTSGNGKSRNTGLLPNLEELKTQFEDSPQETEVNREPVTRQDPISSEKLLKAWKQFASTRKEAGKKQESLILGQEPIFQAPSTVKIKLNSAVQVDTVDNLKSELMPFLRESLANDTLQLEAELEIDQGKPLIYTPAEKFQYLIEKHPPLKTLQKKLGLDPDF